MYLSNWKKNNNHSQIYGLKFIIIINLEYLVTWLLNEVHIVKEMCEL